MQDGQEFYRLYLVDRRRYFEAPPLFVDRAYAELAAQKLRAEGINGRSATVEIHTFRRQAIDKI